MTAPSSQPETETQSGGFLGAFAAAWGIFGVCYILASAIFRILPYTLEAFDYSWTWLQWAVFVGFTIFMGYGEGYKGFQKAFSPRVAARALHLRQKPTLLRTIFAPFFCIGYFGSTKKRKIVAWSLTIGIIVLIVLVRQMSQPWRGIIDFGVVLGLGWGTIALLAYTWKAFFVGGHDHDPELG